MSKISIRFYNDREVRAVWDEEKSKWWFSAVDIVAAITDSPNPRKYWSVMKTRMKKAGNELTTNCSQLKLTAAYGKKYATDTIENECVQILAFTELYTRFDNEKDNNHRWRTAKEHEHRQVVGEFCRRRQIGRWRH